MSWVTPTLHHMGVTQEVTPAELSNPWLRAEAICEGSLDRRPWTMDDEREPRRASVLARVGPALLVVIAVSVSGWFLFWRGNTVPDVRGADGGVSMVEPLLDAGFCVDFESWKGKGPPVHRVGEPPVLDRGGCLLHRRPDPAPGTRRSAGSTVTVTVSGSSWWPRDAVDWDAIPLDPSGADGSDRLARDPDLLYVDQPSNHPFTRAARISQREENDWLGWMMSDS